jgi:hypothetical protein
MVHVPLMFLSELCEFPSAPCLLGKKNLMTPRVSILLNSCASPDIIPVSLRNKKRLAIWHMYRPLLSTTLSIPSYDIGNYVGLRTYLHPLVCCEFVGLDNKGVSTFVTCSIANNRDKLVPVTTAWRVLRLRMEERPPIWKVKR